MIVFNAYFESLIMIVVVMMSTLNAGMHSVAVCNSNILVLYSITSHEIVNFTGSNYMSSAYSDNETHLFPCSRRLSSNIVSSHESCLDIIPAK